MDRSEIYKKIEQLRQDLASETDPEARARSLEHAELNPDMAEAKKVVVGDIASLIGQKAAIESKKEAEQLSAQENEGLDPNEIPEAPHIPSANEILWTRIDRKYDRLYSRYQQDLQAINSTKKSKREVQEKLLRRKFARDFNDFTDITGAANAILDAELLELIASDTISDDDLRMAVFANAAEYAGRNAIETTSDPKNFASIIAGAVEGREHSAGFRAALEAIFNSNPNSFGELQINLANASFEMLDDTEAIRDVVRIAYLKKPFVPTAFTAKAVERRNQYLTDVDITNFLNYIQLTAVYGSLNIDITGFNFGLTPAQEAHIKSINDAARQRLIESGFSRNLSEDERAIVELVRETAIIYDPVEVTDFAGEKVNLNLVEAPENLLTALGKSELFRKRLAQIAPYSYGVRAAKEVMKSGAVHGLSIPLSPKTAVDIYFPMIAPGPPSELELHAIADRLKDILNEILTNAIDADELGVKGYEDTGRLQMVYQNLYGENTGLGIIIYRPAIQTDKNTHSPLQQLAINYAAIRGNESLKGNGLEHLEQSALEEENERIRQQIDEGQSRFLGRRQIKFAMPAELRQMTGLISVGLRLNPTDQNINCVMKLDDGEVELALDRELHFEDEGRISIAYPGIRQYYENMILKLVRHWACGVEVHTSEGVVTEEKEGSTNFGHYAYLRIRPEDGYKYNFSQKQADACLAEQNKDLAVKSEQRKSQDPTGQERNSTYVREFFDPNQEPLVVYPVLE